MNLKKPFIFEKKRYNTASQKPPKKGKRPVSLDKRLNKRKTLSDEEYMSRALDLATKGEGRVAPNPLVGAILVQGGRIIGRGFHREYGGSHAEVHAIEDAKEKGNGDLLKDAILYGTLEPCCHTNKQTPSLCGHYY